METALKRIESNIDNSSDLDDELPQDTPPVDLIEDDESPNASTMSPDCNHTVLCSKISSSPTKHQDGERYITHTLDSYLNFFTH